MATSRVNVLALVADQYRSMADVATLKPARFARVMVWLTPLLVAGVVFVFSLQMRAVSDMVAALGVLAGVFLSAFAVVFSLRVTLDARPKRVLDQASSRLMDESALTMLTAGLFAGVDAIWLAVVSSFADPTQPIATWATAVSAVLSSQVALYFLLSVRRLHKLYTDTFPPFWKQAPEDGNSDEKSTVGDGRTQAR
ncbi:MAG: hypothetical protein ACTIA6_10970 [Pseudoclavibacter sp.]